MFYIAGGPGNSSIAEAAFVVEELAGPETPYDLVFVDQRGTGRSNPLRCPYQDEPEAIRRLWLDMFPTAGLRSCVEALRPAADPALYTTSNAVGDLDAVRRALGYETVTLVGSSYGTRVALAYLREHPRAVSRAILRGPVPTDLRVPLTFARDLDAALDGLIEDCERDHACSGAFPRLNEEIQAVLTRLQASPAEVSVDLPEPAAETVSLRITGSAFAQGVRYMLYSPWSASRLPWLVHRASQDDYGPLARFAAWTGRSVNDGADGLYLSVTCAEDVPFFTLQEALDESTGTLLGNYRVDVQKRACELWPRGELPRGFHGPVVSDVPTLILVGEHDPVAPPRLGRQLGRHLGRHRLVVVPEGGHFFGQMQGVQCLRSLQRSFLGGTPLADLAVGCVDEVKRPPFYLGDDRQAGDPPTAGS